MRVFEFVTERKKKRKMKLGRYFFPGFAYYGGVSDSGDMGGDGGGESIHEDIDIADEVEKFKIWAGKKLHIENLPNIELSQDTEEAQTGHHTGSHIIGDDKIWVYAKNRNLIDILRTVFHELVHVRQAELGMVNQGDSYPGSAIESMADMLAGKYIKIYGKQNNKIFQ